MNKYRVGRFFRAFAKIWLIWHVFWVSAFLLVSAVLLLVVGVCEGWKCVTGKKQQTYSYSERTDRGREYRSSRSSREIRRERQYTHIRETRQKERSYWLSSIFVYVFVGICPPLLSTVALAYDQRFRKGEIDVNELC